MHKHIRTICISVAIVFFLSVGIASATLTDPFYTVGEDMVNGKIYAMILDDDVTTLNLEKQVKLNILSHQYGKDTDYILPHSQGGGTYYIKNVSQYPVHYTMDITDENPLDIPVFFRLRDERGNYLLGDTDSWENISALQSITGELQSGEQSQYTLEWMWDSKGNTYDTEIGIAAKNNEEYTIAVNVQSNPIGSFTTYGDPLNTKTDALSFLLAILLAGGVGAITYLTCSPEIKLKKQLLQKSKKPFDPASQRE